MIRQTDSEAEHDYITAGYTKYKLALYCCQFRVHRYPVVHVITLQERA